MSDISLETGHLVTPIRGRGLLGQPTRVRRSWRLIERPRGFSLCNRGRSHGLANRCLSFVQLSRADIGREGQARPIRPLRRLDDNIWDTGVFGDFGGGASCCGSCGIAPRKDHVHTTADRENHSIPGSGPRSSWKGQSIRLWALEAY